MNKLIFTLFLIFVLGCGSIQYSKACFGDKCLDLEVMGTQEEKQKGLMFRESLGENKAMLFLYNEEGERNFWMKNTKFPIDIIWLDKENKIIHIEPDVPPCLKEPCQIYSPGREAMNVIELNAGFALENNINVGDEVRFV